MNHIYEAYASIFITFGETFQRVSSNVYRTVDGSIFLYVSFIKSSNSASEWNFIIFSFQM